MTAEGGVARRYAEAFVNALGEGPSVSLEERLRTGLTELEGVAQVDSGSKDLQRFLGSLEIGPEEKERLLNRLWSDGDGGETKALLHLLLKWDRMEHLPAILAEARAVAEERQGILRGTVATAHPVSSAETERLAQAIGKALKKRVMLEREVDPGLIGGVRVSIGSKLLDGSIRTYLDEIREQLKAVKVN